jgi:4-methylaminobutanoate oxidase (formaldehyde-forming)
MALAEWVATGAAPYDLWPVDIRRFGPAHRSTDYVRTRTMEAYAKHYTIAWPSEEMKSARPTRRSPLYAHLKAAGACFGEKLGWERPNWFAGPGKEPVDRYSYQRPGWFDAVGHEHRAAREGCVLIDQTSFAKFTLKGPDAAKALNWIAAGNVDRPVGSLVYTQMLNAKGGIECDLTVVRRATDEFYIVTGTGFATHDFDWIVRNLRGDAHLIDVTSGSAVLSLMGPKSRDILQSLTPDNLSNAAFPFGTARPISIAGCPVLALRVTYVGELGWELHMPTEVAVTVYETLMATGQITNAGYRAIETLRLEKGYRAWGSDIGPDHTPVEAGLAWAVKMKSGLPFLGREAIASQLANGVRKRLATFTAAPEVVLLGRETIYRNGERVGWLSSGGYGHTVGKSIGLGYVRHPGGVTEDFVLSGTYELEVASERVPAHVTLAPLHDPQNQRVKA